MKGLEILLLGGCFNGCWEHTRDATGMATRIWNLSDSTVELQIRVGSILKKVHTLRPGCSKRVKSKSIYKAYMPEGEGGRGLLYYYDEACQPYVWINDLRGGFARVVREQYLSLNDLRECSEIRILRDEVRGCICIRKRTRPDCC
ncbi:hypothetical protein MLD38_012024 [Melastoma candidum]|uniref:Uncharacterized protein n=1 Tax=Melastoma candidum TaxID=119954 RepID=A0ACB9R8J6_9MYRT|nr:hypothetical protein MLD38_012024 [Melastoma candidum]